MADFEQLESILSEIRQCEERINTLKQDSNDAVRSLILSTQENDRLKVASDLYWNYPTNSKIIAEAVSLSNIAFTKAIPPFFSSLKCSHCGAPLSFQSKQALQDANKAMRQAAKGRRHYPWLLRCSQCSALGDEKREKVKKETEKQNAPDIGDLRQMPYREYLKTTHWVMRRSRSLRLAHYRCQVCNASHNLNVHHRTYDHRGNEKDEDLIVLCGDCHQLFHDNGRLTK